MLADSPGHYHFVGILEVGSAAGRHLHLAVGGYAFRWGSSRLRFRQSAGTPRVPSTPPASSVVSAPAFSLRIVSHRAPSFIATVLSRSLEARSQKPRDNTSIQTQLLLLKRRAAPPLSPRPICLNKEQPCVCNRDYLLHYITTRTTERIFLYKRQSRPARSAQTSRRGDVKDSLAYRPAAL